MKGYHFFIVRFDAEDGASLQIDPDGTVHSDATLTTPADHGFCMGSIVGGLPEGFEIGVDFAVYVMLGVNAAAIPHDKFDQQVGAWPTLTEISSDLTIDNSNEPVLLPSLTFAEGTTLTVNSTLDVPTGADAVVDTLKLGAATAVVNVNGGSLAAQALTATPGATLKIGGAGRRGRCPSPAVP